MQIRLTKSVKDGEGWHEPGTILDRDEKECNSLVRQKAAEILVEPIVDEDDKEVSEVDLAEIAEKFISINGINADLAYRLIEAGYSTVQSIADAEIDDLIKIKGIGKGSVKKIQESAEDVLLDSED